MVSDMPVLRSCILRGRELTACPAWLQDFARDAVVAADGCTYERAAIEGWMQQSHSSAQRRLHHCSTHLFQNRLYTAAIGVLMQAY